MLNLYYEIILEHSREVGRGIEGGMGGREDWREGGRY